MSARARGSAFRYALNRVALRYSVRLNIRAAPIDSRDLLLPGAGASLLGCGLIYLGSRRLRVEYAPHSGKAGEYLWRLAQPSSGSRASAWLGYTLHQLALWSCIYIGQRRALRYSRTVRRLNWVALGLNIGFSGLHFVQTQLWYDGLAQDVPEGSALGSVAFMLMLILVLEEPRRGLAFGIRPPLRREFVDLVRRYHGYIFSWAIVYTFWYHPMEGKPGHLVGFLYMALLMLQSSLLFTYAHRDRRWTFVLELMVLPHALTTAISKRNQLAPMFGFGFLGMLLIAQSYNFKLPPRLRRLAYASYLFAATAIFAQRRELHRLPDILRIPLLEYAVVAVLYIAYLLSLWIAERWQNLNNALNKVL
jgi:hypothetical protein